jgi:hypothetical protein
MTLYLAFGQPETTCDCTHSNLASYTVGLNCTQLPFKSCHKAQLR